MKFTDGLWLIKEGVKASYALDVQSTIVKDDTISLAVASKTIRHRGDTLGGPLLNVEISSPGEGIIGVKTEYRNVCTT